MKFLFFLPFFFLLTACSGLDNLAQNLLYPIKIVNQTPFPEKPTDEFQETTLQTPKSQVTVWHYENKSNLFAPVIIFFHGNAYHIGSMNKTSLTFLKQFQTHVVVFDYPSYGKSKGELSENSFVTSGNEVFKFAQQKFPQSHIIIWGYSLGAGVAMQVASQNTNKISKLVISAGWDTVKNLAKAQFKSVAKKVSDQWYITNEYNSAKAASTITVPTLIHHGTNDDVIPYQLGVNLSKAFKPELIHFRVVPNRNHNDIFTDPTTVNEMYHFITRFQ